MDTLTFTAEMTKALAWPLTIILALLLLRRPLADLIPLLQRLRYKDLELDFGKRVQELASEIKKELPGGRQAGGAQQRGRNRLADLAHASPRAAVLEAWLEVEEAAIAAAKRHQLKLSDRERRSPSTLEQALVDSQILDENKRGIFSRLRNLRNAAAHASDFDLDSGSAIIYAGSANRLAEYLRKA
jgi:uncharacterized protein YutE (UPF0331/DUF86 family)